MGKPTSPVGSGARPGGRARGRSIAANAAMREIFTYKAGYISKDAMRSTIDGLRRPDAVQVAAQMGVRVRGKVSAGGIRKAIAKDLGVD